LRGSRPHARRWAFHGAGARLIWASGAPPNTARRTMNEHEVLERALERMGPAPIELDDVYRQRERGHLHRRLAAGSTAIAVVALTVALFVRAIDQATPVTPVGTSPTPGDIVTYTGLPSFADIRSIAADQIG